MADFYLVVSIANRDELHKIDHTNKHYISNNYSEAQISARHENSGRRSVKKIEKISQTKSPRATDSKFTDGNET